MPYAWFVCGYDVDAVRPNVRRCAMDRFTPTIFGEGGDWAESEVLGGNAIVKVRASDITLTTIAGTAGFQRIPNHFNLDDLLSDLTTAQRNAIQTRILAMGYTQAEINAMLGSTLGQWRGKTLRQLLNFICQRRLKARFDDVLKQIVLDGAAVGCRTPQEVNDSVI